ncbi:MAG TPA: bifunctional DNA-binding transcriptional regulator/O6-methylguanine-DNA methyltransferase Ada [Candidatus Acidoferrales bacterium]|jgi:AraC family transcriptional regulator of adaptative response/methylated-DNA-[protein]-cysteine methyltransferase|nr:bifunctional DNA-binding transcriptional regulator/O6-methylguanine-DNA methyltransferase Ada [Candidatus Acidoferrales bacterium]
MAMKTQQLKSTSASITAQAAKRYWQATLHRDPRADGSFFFAVRSTHIYCRPSCPARRPLRRNTLFFRTPQDAEKEGFRPCQRCRPKQQNSSIALVQRVSALLASTEDESLRLTSLSAQVNSSPAKLRRAFRRATGLSPKEFQQAFRLRRFKQMLRDGSSVTDALYACGFGSSSRLYERANAHLGMTPASYRKGGAGMEIKYTVANTSLGKVLMGATERGVSAVYLGENEKALVDELRKEYANAEIVRTADGHESWLKEIVRRVEGNAPSEELSLDVQATAFQRRVWQELQKIPRGTTWTYTQVAKSLGKPRSVRAVARACATNPVSIVVPCHRVIRTDGTLAGYRWGLSRKEKLLEREAAGA